MAPVCVIGSARGPNRDLYRVCMGCSHAEGDPEGMVSHGLCATCEAEAMRAVDAMHVGEEPTQPQEADPCHT